MGEQITEVGNSGKSAPSFEGYIDKREVGKRLQIRPRTVDDWLKRGILPFYRIGRSVRLKWSEVEQHLRQTSRICHADEDEV
jgi:excisionase family DNA binding protein